MDKQPVGQLPDINQSSNDDELMIITNDETNELRKEKISDFITDLTSADEGNAIEKGADGKLFVSDTVNTSNIEGVLSLDNIPQLTTEKLPNSGVNAGFYRNPVNLNVNAKGQITSVEDGESGVINDITPFVTNTILSAQNQNITNASVQNASYVNTGCTISEAGVASGFSADNRILLSKTMSSATASTVEIPFTTGSDVNTDQTLLYMNNHANSLGISQGKIVLRYDGNILSGTTTLAANTAYVALLTRTASDYTVQVKSAAGDYITEITLRSSNNYFAGKSIYVGGGDANYFQGTIDLANLTIKDDSNTSNVQIIGTPTLNNGILSNIGTENYAQLNYIPQNIQNFEWIVKFTTGAKVTTPPSYQVIFGSIENYKVPQLIMQSYESSGLQFFLGSTGTSWDVIIKLETLLTANTTYLARCGWDGTNAYLYYKTEEATEWTLIGQTAFSGPVFWSDPTTFGVDESLAANYWQGSIALNETSLTVNGNMVWTFRNGYWSVYALSDFQTVTVSGTYQLLMPNGRNADKTLNNVTKTITLNDTLLYSPADGEKTVLVKEDGELMIRDYYAETYDQPADVPLNGVWMNKTANTLTEQAYNFMNLTLYTGTINADGVANGAANGYAQLSESYTLGNNWNFDFYIESSTNSNSEVITFEPSENTLVHPTTSCKAFEVIGNGASSITAKFRRDDVYIVNREITVSTAYEVTKTDTSGAEPTTVTGYVQTAGTAESYVTAGTQVYQDVAFETPLEQAAADTWTYTGDTYANTEIQTGYCKEGGVTLVPAETVVYADANCTSVQGTASGTDYTYSGDRAESIICTLNINQGTSDYNKYSIGFNGSQYYFNEATYNSTDLVQDNISIRINTSEVSVKLPGTILTISNKVAWEWNGVRFSEQDFVPFVGAKLGKVTDNGTTITAMELDMPLTLAKDTDVVHQTGDEEIYGKKKFNDWTVVRDANLTVMQTDNYPNRNPILFVDYNSAPNKTYYSQIETRNCTVNIQDENLPANCYYGRHAVSDKNGLLMGGFYVGTSGNVNQTLTVLQNGRYVNGVSKVAQIKLLTDVAGNPLCEFPRCTTRATTNSSAGSNRVAVVVQNYVSGTSWYRVWSDGWIEQGGRTAQGTTVKVVFPKPFRDTNYSINVQDINNSYIEGSKPTNMTKTGFTAMFRYSVNMSWNACGY